MITEPFKLVTLITFITYNIVYIIYDVIIIYFGYDYNCSPNLCYWMITDCLMRVTLFPFGYKMLGELIDKTDETQTNDNGYTFYKSIYTITVWILFFIWFIVFIWGIVEVWITFANHCTPYFVLINISGVCILAIIYMIISGVLYIKCSKKEYLIIV